MYQNVIRVLDDLSPDGAIYHRADGVRLLGNPMEWREVHQWICDNISQDVIFPGSDNLSVKNEDGIKIYRQRLSDRIKEIKRTKRSQKLADWNNLSGMLSNWITFLLALWGAITGSIALLNGIFNWF